MTELEYPVQSNRTLIKASLLAVIVAVVITVTVILPAEYNIDPTGFGSAIGITSLADTNMSEQDKSLNLQKAKGYQKNEETIIVPANQGVEYKFQMQQHSNLTYHWQTEGEVIYFDFHGEPKGDTTGYFESYSIAITNEVKGSMTMPFEGVHGWYWKNTSDKAIKVTLATQGVYQIKGLIH